MVFSLPESEFYRRLENAKAHPHRSNCLGTLFYLIGARKNDQLLGPPKAKKLFPNWLELSLKTRVGEVLDNFYTQSLLIPLIIGVHRDHSGLTDFPELSHVLLTHPFSENQIIHRKNKNESVEVGSVEEILSNYSRYQAATLYRLKRNRLIW